MYPSSDPIDPNILKLVQAKSLVRIVDDDETVSESYEFMLRCAGWNCRIFNSPEDYLASENIQIGCLILDVRMPGLSGLQLQQKLEILEREIPIIFVTGHGDVDMAVLALKRGAKDFMLKPVDPQRLKGAVFQACQSDWLNFLRTQKEEAAREATSSLSQREREVAQLLAQGLLYKQIAEKLGCSERTVKFHKARIAEKLGVKTPAEIALKLSSNSKNKFEDWETGDI